MTRVCLTRHVPSSGFLTPSTGSSPSGLADTLGPLPLLGSPREALSNRKAVVRCRTPAPSRLRCSKPRTLRNTRSESSAGSKVLEPALPWFHGRGSRAPESPSEHITPAPSQWLSPPQSPLAPEPSASGRTMTRRTRHHRVFRQCGNQRIYWRSAAPMGFSLIRKTLWRLPVCYSAWIPAYPSEPDVLGGT